MGILLDVFLPLSLAFIMFALGVGLTIEDFARVRRAYHGFIAGAVAQVVLLPVVAFVILMIFPLPPMLAVGVMILSFCPGGVTSNIMTKLAGGAVALSVTLTAVISLVSVITVPVLVAWSTDHFMGLAAPEINVASLAIAMFLITAVPAAIGVSLRHFAPGAAGRIDKPVNAVAVVLFVVIVVGALAANWAVFVENLALLGPAVILLNAVMLGFGYGVGRFMGLNHEDRIAVAIEAGVQNATLGITVGALIANIDGLSEYSLPAGVYGITMYFVTAPFILWARRRR